jgi:hypothetical protein
MIECAAETSHIKYSYALFGSIPTILPTSNTMAANPPATDQKYPLKRNCIVVGLCQLRTLDGRLLAPFNFLGEGGINILYLNTVR